MMSVDAYEEGLNIKLDKKISLAILPPLIISGIALSSGTERKKEET